MKKNDGLLTDLLNKKIAKMTWWMNAKKEAGQTGEKPLYLLTSFFGYNALEITEKSQRDPRLSTASMWRATHTAGLVKLPVSLKKDFFSKVRCPSGVGSGTHGAEDSC